MANYRVVSSDNHVFEPPDLWTSRIDPKFKDRAPKIERDERGGDWWVCDGSKWISVFAGAQIGRRFEDPGSLTLIETFDNVRPGGYIPEEHVKDMDADGQDVSIVYPSAGLNLYGVADSELLTAITRAYNDWLAEFCKAYPDRIKGIAMLNMDDVQVGVKELERCEKMGLAGGLISVGPPAGREYNLPDYEPLWAAAQDLGMPLGLHIGTFRPGPAFETREGQSPAGLCNADHWVRQCLAQMIFAGVFEHYPKLQVGSIEHEVSWATYFLDRLDYTYTQRVRRDSWHRYKEDMLPSDYFHRNVFVSFQEDAAGVRDRHTIGVDNLQWGSDYPHPESTFPRTHEILEEVLAGCSEEEKAKIVGGNAARVYHLD